MNRTPRRLSDVNFNYDAVTEVHDNSLIIRVFTFGTLQAGGRLAPMLEGAILDGPHWASVTGYDLHSNTSYSYPYLLKSENPDAKVYGSLYKLRVNTEQFRSVHSMELGCGYVAHEATVTREDTGDATQAMAYLWPAENGHLGPHIPGGQWVQWEETEGRKRYQDYWDLRANRFRFSDVEA